MVYDEWKKVRDRLQSFEHMKLADLWRSESHPIEQNQIIPSAQRRLRELHLDDIEELWSLRITGKKRLWCIKDAGQNVFSILWWDPEHKICPVTIKHT